MSDEADPINAAEQRGISSAVDWFLDHCVIRVYGADPPLAYDARYSDATVRERLIQMIGKAL